LADNSVDSSPALAGGRLRSEIAWPPQSVIFVVGRLPTKKNGVSLLPNAALFRLARILAKSRK
jgi:hypothetical protein